MGNFAGDDEELEKSLGVTERRPLQQLETGWSYEGYWLPGTYLPHGRGVMLAPDSGTIFEGYFSNGLLQGKGRIVSESGSFKIGQFLMAR